MSDSSEPGSRQKIIDDLHRDLGGRTNKDQLQTKLSSSDKNVKRTIQEYIAKKGLTQRLLDEKWITPDQYDEIKVLAKILKDAGYGGGGKRRYSTRSKKYKKSNKRSKRTRTLRRKRYSRKS